MSTPVALDTFGLNESAASGFAPVTREQALDAAACIAAHALSLEDQKRLTEMTGLDASPAPENARERRPRVRPDSYRRGKKGRG